MKNMTKALLLASAVLLALALAACNGDNGGATETEGAPETESETELALESEQDVDEEEEQTRAPRETVDYTSYAKVDGYAFLCDEQMTNPSPRHVSLSNTVGSTLSIAKDCYLVDLTFFSYSWGDDEGEMDLCFWQWEDSYSTTKKYEPDFTYTIKNCPDNSWVTVTLPENLIGSGEWYYEFRNGSQNKVGVAVTNGVVSSADSPDVTPTQCYTSGAKARGLLPQAYATYVKYDTSKKAEAPDTAAYTKLTEGKAHVIILAGQDNATGISRGDYLATHVSEEQMARYRAGYSNVKIYYNADGNSSVDFVPVKLGQGQDNTKFGPELGLAEYLSTAYPDETFYIIKSTATAASLYQDWGINGGATYFLKAHIRAGLDALEAAGLEPEIFAMVWMQGEADSTDLEQARAYGDHQADLVSRIKAAYSTYMAPGGMAVLDASIYQGGGNTFASLVNCGKRTFAARTQNYYYIDTVGLDTLDENNDPAHYDSDDMIKLGELFGKALATVLTNAGYPTK